MEQRNSNNNNPPSQMTISPPTASPYAMYPHPSMYPMYYAPSMVSYEMFSAPNAAANTAASIPRNKFMYTQANPTAYTHTMDNTNIYIRGLAPDTTDADLEALCSIYGRILSSKAIVDLKTGICKGFGFAMFETMDMASMALDGLSRQGFLVTFAVQGPRGDSEDFSQKLDQLSDDCSTNLYISNLPMSLTRDDALVELLCLTESDIVSSKILVDIHGHSRGVGFVRFSTREAAQEVIDSFHGTVVQGSSSPLQVRFADTEGQKKLKSMFGRKTRSYAPRSGGNQLNPHQSGSTYGKPPPFHQPVEMSTPGSSASSSPTLPYSSPPVPSPTSTNPGAAPAYMMAPSLHPVYYHPYPVPHIPQSSSLFSPSVMDPSFDTIALRPSSPTHRQRSVSSKNSKNNVKAAADDTGAETLQQDRRVSGVSSASSETTLVESGEDEDLCPSEMVDLSVQVARLGFSVSS